jgi:hypothetical protein
MSVHVTFFPLPPKPPGCDFNKWTDYYMTPKDIEYMSWVKKNRVAMSRG